MQCGTERGVETESVVLRAYLRLCEGAEQATEGKHGSAVEPDDCFSSDSLSLLKHVNS